VIIWRASDWRPRLQFSWRHLRELFSFSIYLLFSQFLHTLNTKIDQLFIGYFLGTSVLGIYDIAGKLLLNLYNLLSQVVGTVFFPMLSFVGVGDTFRQWLLKSCEWTALAAVPVFAGLALIAPDVLPLVYGDKWSEGIPIMQILAALYIVYIITRVTNSGVAAAGYPKYIFLLHALSTICHVGAMYVAVQISLVAVALAYVVRVYALWPLYLLAMKKSTGVSLGAFVKRVYPSFAAGSIMVVALMMSRSFIPGLFTGHIRVLVVSVIIGVLLYAGGLLLFAPTRIYDKISSRLSFGRCKAFEFCKRRALPGFGGRKSVKSQNL
jgi:PST family polysaccharide transporter